MFGGQFLITNSQYCSENKQTIGMYTHTHTREMSYVLDILTIIATRVAREKLLCECIVESHLSFLPVVCIRLYKQNKHKRVLLRTYLIVGKYRPSLN